MSDSANVIETSPENTFSWPLNYSRGDGRNRRDLKDYFLLFSPELAGAAVDCQGERHGTVRVPGSGPG